MRTDVRFWLATAAHQDVENAVDGWRRGYPVEEVAFTNRLTERLSSHRPRAAGGDCFLPVITDVVNLHRAQRTFRSRKDAFGCDLAVTIWLGGANVLKTALFQIKRYCVTCQEPYLIKHQPFPPEYPLGKDQRVFRI